MRFTIGRKLFLGFGACIFIIAGLVLFNFFELENLRKLQDEGAKRGKDAQEAAVTGRLGEVMYRVVADGIINRDMEVLKKEWESVKAESRKELDIIKDIVDTDQEREWYKSADDYYNALLDLIDNKMIPALNATKDVTEEIKDYDGQADEIITGFVAPLTSIRESLNNEQIEADAAYDKTINFVIFISTALAILAFIVSLIIAFVITRGITKPILSIVGQADKIAKGDLNQEKLEIKTKDETGILADSFGAMVDVLKYKANILVKIADGDLTSEVKLASDIDAFGKALVKMNESLNDALAQVNSAVEQTASGSNQVAQASQALSQGATEQASSLEEITSSITEISSQAKQNADNAIQASGLAKKAMENAEGGNKQMQDLVVAMGEINKSADMIKKIVKVIDDIAFQTNLLALNANVEAARAGKYGKGFAVVAEEVRNLAGRSAESVNETTQMVEEAIKNISSGNELVETTAKQLEEIMDGANKVSDLVDEIATASKEQTQGLDQINQGLGQIDQVTQSNTANAEESASAAEELASQAQQLKAIVSRFKLSKDAVRMSEEQKDRREESSHMKKLQYLNEQSKGVSEKDNKNSQTKKPVNPNDVIRLDDADFGKF